MDKIIYFTNCLQSKYSAPPLLPFVLLLTGGQYCQLLANDFGQINFLKVGPTAKKFGRTHYLLLGSVLKALLPQFSSKKASSSVD
jgi:hypothetical protein